MSISPENAPHNLEFTPEDNRKCEAAPPERSVLHADFAAEAHGFTGFEKAGRGSDFRSGKVRFSLFRKLLNSLKI